MRTWVQSIVKWLTMCKLGVVVGGVSGGTGYSRDIHETCKGSYKSSLENVKELS